ncbi:transposase [Streptomyces sp. NPDC060048]|uniref:transposase n=1 Tax=unclassified Streptomyces TaxID=2593676 RepID=UPI003688CB6B
MRVRDELGELFADAEFAQAFGVRGRQGWSPGQLALVTVLQFAENLTDRAAAHRVRFGMDFKYALGLELDDPGFDASVLSEFRARLVAHNLEERALDLLLAALKSKGLVKAGGQQRTDSTRVLAAVRDLNRLELAGETLRAALEALSARHPAGCPRWYRSHSGQSGTGRESTPGSCLLPRPSAPRWHWPTARTASRFWKLRIPQALRCGCENFPQCRSCGWCGCRTTRERSPRPGGRCSGGRARISRRADCV